TSGRSLAVEGSISTPERTGGPVERLLEFWRPFQSRRMARREFLVEATAAVAFLVPAIALAGLAASSRSSTVGFAAVIVLTYAVSSRVRAYLGAGYAMPNQFVLVPMLYLLPADSVPLLVAVALAGRTMLDAALRRAHPERIPAAIADAWHV